ncbi:MAG: nitroreductase [Deltaproteobacteria bacterium]|nr:nitroreductase [Deltaproteobacteria bacterium]
MEIFQAVTTRRSIRRFKPDPVPEALLREILDAARWSPSWGNTQPWEIAVVTGEPLEGLRKANRQRFLDGVIPEPDTPMPGIWPEPLKQRYQGIGKKVLTALSIPRGDEEARLRHYGDMFAFFGAPCLLLFCVDKSLAREYAMLDTGAIVQSVCLLAHARGLGACIMAASVNYPALIRQIVPIPETRAILAGAALGYPDAEAPINQFARERANPDEFTLWCK